MKAINALRTAANIETNPTSIFWMKLWRCFSQLFFFNLFFSGKISRSRDWENFSQATDKKVAELVDQEKAVFYRILKRVWLDEAGEVCSEQLMPDDRPAGWLGLNILTWHKCFVLGLTDTDKNKGWHLCFKAVDDFTMVSTATMRCKILNQGSVSAMLGDGHVVFFAVDEKGKFLSLERKGEFLRESFKITSVPLL